MELTFPNNIRTFDYQKYGAYIPFIYQLYKIESDRCHIIRNETDREYNNESFKYYLESLFWDSDEYDMLGSHRMMDLRWIISEIAKDDKVIIGKYTIIHNTGFYGYWTEPDGSITDIMLEEKYELFCNENCIFTVYNGGFNKCLEQIIIHAGGYESWKMLEHSKGE